MSSTTISLGDNAITRMKTPARRSVRKRKANTKYLGTGWDKDALRLLRESSESSGSSPSGDSAKEVQSVDEDFRSQIIADAEASSSSEADALSDASNGSGTHTPPEPDEDHISLSSNEATTLGQQGRRTSAAIGDLPRNAGSGRSRGVAPIQRRSINFPQTFGPEDADLKPVLHARNTWLEIRDKSLPSRKTLSAIQSLPGEPAELLGDLAVEDDDISIAARQELTDLASEQATRYLLPHAPHQSVVLGPIGQQKLIKAEYLKPLEVSHAWSEATTPRVVEDTVDAGHRLPASFQKGPSGWIVNVGEKVRSLAWLPGNVENAQLLAIACRSTSQQRNSVVAPSQTRSPAFYASTSYPSCIQLWAFQTTNDRKAAASKQPLLASGVPQLRIAYALDAGDVRQLQWQPSTTSKHLKLLAVLSTDGCVRLLALDPVDLGGKLGACIRVKTAPMQIQPAHHTVFTTMCWASTSDLILGASDGAVHVYNVQDHANAVAYLSLPLHSTYIMSIVSTFPSSIPSFVASTSAAGDLLLTDLRAPDQDRVHLPKARLPTKPLIYCPQTRSFITVTDTTGVSEPRHPPSLVQCHDLRHFYQSRQICKLPAMSGAATALAGSPHHPCILIGNSRGSVFATNYLRRVLPCKSGRRGGDGFLQTLYEYDWRPLSPLEQKAMANVTDTEGTANQEEDQKQASSKEPIDLFHGHDVRPGISRFTEDFLPEPIDMNPRKPTTSRAKRKRSHSRGTQKAPKAAGAAAESGTADVIFEEEQAVTCLEWNPNLRYAGWAAVGWGSGIVKVEDLSHGGE